MPIPTNASPMKHHARRGARPLAICISAGIFAALFALDAAFAQAYPSRPLRFVIGSAPGSGNDITGRLFAARVSESLGQQIVVENRPGGGQIIAAEIVARATPDGYTLLQCGVVTMAINPALHQKLSYQPLRDFTPITSIATTPNVLVVHPGVPTKTAKEFVAHALANPGKLNYGSGGVGSTLHLSMEMLQAAAGTKMTHVPYKGGGLAMVDLYAGHITSAFQNLPVALAPVKVGKVRALAVTSAHRSKHLPDVPTFIESGYPTLEITVWYGACAPAGVPRPIVARLNEVMVQVLKRPDVNERFVELGTDPAPSTSQQFAAFLKSEGVKWAKAAKDSGATP